ncbi:uncharacterized protein LOC111370120 [Olea europaea var. sylvestris]|uniref:uncharacterized protein LOC111370120 n=1 Tax=Olea europaea var. sylvestris TaxID=158386 RepID=UPI000C1CDD17|nr:uncharacterized protein LOC111370120 [Olea europaea var. sylvestris]
MLDNRWVVPYNPYLSAKFDCQINVEVCSSIKALKYLYKYVYKGHDRINCFIEIYPTVYALQLHIKDHQYVTYNSKDDLSVIIGNDFKTLNGVTVNTYREPVLLHGLLKGDNHCEECLFEAIIYKMPSSLRRLFATLLTLCNPNHPKLLWDRYKAYMIDDYVHRNICVKDAEIQALEDINSILESSRKNINDYGIVSFLVNIDETQRLARMIVEETMNFNIQRDFNCVEKFNKEQRFAYDKVMEKVKNDSSGTFFIDGPGGTGKTFLYKALLTAVRGQHFIALATTSSGVAASLLPGGRTAHSRFKIPLETIGEVNCSVSKQSALGIMLKMSGLIIWDEAPMVNRCAIEAVDRMLRDITDCNLPYGGKVIVFGGDFRQVLSMVPRGKKDDVMKASLVFSGLWPSYLRLPLVENMRAKSDPMFCTYLLRIGNGTEEEHTCKCIMLPNSIILPFEDEITSLKILIHHVFPNIQAYVDNLHNMINRVILTPTNECVDYINKILLEQIPDDFSTYYSFDEAIDKSEQSLHEDFLNTLTPNGIPPHELKLKVNCPVMLLRNINPSEGLCNGTRLVENLRKTSWFIEIILLLLLLAGSTCVVAGLNAQHGVNLSTPTSFRNPVAGDLLQWLMKLQKDLQQQQMAYSLEIKF